MKRLIFFRLTQKNGNGRYKTTLCIRMEEDRTLSYSHYQSWSSTGIGLSLEDMHLPMELPLVIYDFENVHDLRNNIEALLNERFDINEVIIANDFKDHVLSK